MKKTAIFCTAAFVSAACAYAYVPRDAPSADAELERVLAGRVEGPTRSCVRSRDLSGNRSISEDAILFRGPTSRTVYINRPPAGCPRMGGPGRAIRVRTTSSQLCRGDIVEVFDPLTNFGFGACGLGDFTEYRRTPGQRR